MAYIKIAYSTWFGPGWQKGKKKLKFPANVFYQMKQLP